MINVTVAGRLTKDAELRPAGSSQVCSFSVASDTGFGDRKQTHFFECSLWGNQGAALNQYLQKGNPVTVIGEFSEREYNGKQYKELRVNSIELQGGGQSQGQQSQQNNQGYNNQQSQGGQSYNQAPQHSAQPPQNTAMAGGGMGPVDDDIPFNRFYDGQL